jgi:hypothetical protein
MRLFLDDERTAPDGADWVTVRSAHVAMMLMERLPFSEISLDHDLGDEKVVGTGYDVLCWLERRAAMGDYVPRTINVHTANSSARIKMMLAVKSIRDFQHGPSRMTNG